MSTYSNVHIVSDGTGQGTKVYVDGVEVKGAQALGFEVEAGEVGSATIRVVAPSLDLGLEQWRVVKETEPTDQAARPNSSSDDTEAGE